MDWMNLIDTLLGLLKKLFSVEQINQLIDMAFGFLTGNN